MVRAFDLDGVLADFHTGYRALILEHTGITLDPPLVWGYEKGKISNKQLNHIWDTIKTGDFWETLGPLPEAPAALARIRQQRSDGDYIYFVTARPGAYAKHLTEFWLDNLGFECPTVLIADAEEKGKLCAALGVEVFLDDKPENCRDVKAACPEAEVYILDQPYNRNTDVDLNGVIRVSSILDPRIMGEQPVDVAA